MTYRIDDQIVLRHPPTGPLVPRLGAIAEDLHAQQYSLRTISQRLRRIVLFSEWLNQQEIELSSLSCADVAQYLRTNEQSAYLKARASLRYLMDHLRCKGVITLESGVIPSTPVERCIEDYRRYLQRQRNLADNTIKLYTRFCGEFLRHHFADTEVDLCRLQSGDVIAFVRHATTRWTNRGSMQLMTAGLRSFLRYVHAHAEGMPDLAAQVPGVANWKMTTLPRAITTEQTEKLLASVERTTVVGRRNYAILVLFARLGLRAVEVASLMLDDIDWKAATVTVTLKGGRRCVHPLTEQIGEAISDYLQNGRPPSDDRRVFLRVHAPFRGFHSPAGIGGVVRSCIRHAGINDTPTKGSHQFRHGLATQMLSQGASLHEIGDVLGHCSPDTTRIYAKVDLATLRTLALAWPGGPA